MLGFVQGAACCSKSGKCTTGVHTPISSLWELQLRGRKDIVGPHTSDGDFFPKLCRQKGIWSFILRFFSSQVWAYLFLGKFILTALMYGHEKNVPLKPIFQMCFLVAVVTLEVYSDPLRSVMLCHKMQATRLIGLKELLCKMANLMAHSSEYWMGHISICN